MAEPVRKPPADRKPETAPSEDPFRYGFRWRTIRLPNGKTDIEEGPLTLEDLLDPQLEDHEARSQHGLPVGIGRSVSADPAQR
jgi:hypothetical protein